MAESGPPAGITIRPAGPDDVESLFEIRTRVRENHQSHGELAGLGVTPGSVTQMLGTDCGAWIAFDGAAPVAFSMANATVRLVFAMFVVPGYEGRGLGRALMRRAEEWLFLSGAIEIWLTTGDDPSLRAHGFYRRLGWTRAGRVEDGQIRYIKRSGDPDHVPRGAFLPDNWHTARLSIRTGAPADVLEFTGAYNACSGLRCVDPTFHVESQEAIAELVQRSLDRDERAVEVFHLQGIRESSSGEVLGYFHLSYRHPRPRLVWISMFVLHPRYQSSGLGGEVVDALLPRLQESASYDAVWLRVYIGNRAALRFWIRHDFRTIVRFDDDPRHAEGQPSLILERPLAMDSSRPRDG